MLYYYVSHNIFQVSTNGHGFVLISTSDKIKPPFNGVRQLILL